MIRVVDGAHFNGVVMVIALKSKLRISIPSEEFDRTVPTRVVSRVQRLYPLRRKEVGNE
jgi:hypothetical protein